MVEGGVVMSASSEDGAPSAGSSAARARVWGAIGLFAQLTFTLGWLVADTWQGPRYSAIRYSISDETAATAPHAWFLITCQTIAGLGTIGFALFGLRRVLAPAGKTAAYAPWMMAAGAICYLVLLSRLPCRLADPGCTVHHHFDSAGGLTDAIVSGLAIGVLVITPFPLWRRMRELSDWRPLRPLMIGARLLGVLLLIATASQGPYTAGPDEGLFERALAIVAALWISVVALKTIRTPEPGDRVNIG
jgi:Protein of unknown function (DUF998)